MNVRAQTMEKALLGDPRVDANSARNAISRHSVRVVFVCLLSDFLLLTIVIPYVPQLLTTRAPAGVGIFSATLIGMLFAAKPMIQIVANPFAGMLVERTGPRRLLLVAALVMAASAAGFAVSRTYASLLLARAVQGVASAMTWSSGMAFLCELHKTKEARASAMGNAMGGMALGVLGGPLIGGVLFSRFGSAGPMSFVGIVVMVSVVLQLHLSWMEGRAASMDASKAGAQARHTRGYGTGADSGGDVREGGQEAEGQSDSTKLRTVYCDPMFLAVALALMAGNAIIGMLEPLFQLYMAQRFGVSSGYRGLIWSATTVGYLGGTPLAGAIAARPTMRHQKRKMVAAGLLLMAIALPIFPSPPPNWSSSAAVAVAIAALFVVGIGMALVDVPSQPLLADVVDFRGLTGYGVAFSIADVAGCVGFIVGPLLGGFIASCTAAADQAPTGVSSPASTSQPTGANVRVDVERACAIFGAVAFLVAPVIVAGVSRAETSASASASDCDCDTDGCSERATGVQEPVHALLHAQIQ